MPVHHFPASDANSPCLSLQQYEDLFANAPVGIFVSTSEGRFYSVNNAMAHLLGYASTQEVMQGITDIPAQVYADAEDSKKVLQLLHTQGEVVDYECRFLRRDGTRVWVSLHARVVRDEKGRNAACQWFVTDITERKEREEYWRHILEATNDGIWDYNLRTGKFQYSDRWAEMLGYSQGEVSDFGCFCDDNIHPEDAGRFHQAFQDYVHGRGSSYEIEFRLRTKAGDYKWIYSRGRALERDSSGQPLRVVGAHTDIHDRKLAEQRERESDERFRLMFLNAPMPYQSLDEQGDFLEVNQTFLDVLGYRREEIIGKNFGDFLHPDWIEHFKDNFPKFKAVGEVLGVQFEMVKKDGSSVLVYFNGKIQRDEQGRFQRTHCIFQDLTDLKRVESELKTALKDLRKSFRTTIQTLVSAVEIRDPYTAGHQIRVANLGCAIATEMGFPQDEVDGLHIVGTVHDIGKLCIPAEILSKPTKLTELEFALVKEHPRMGYEILKDVESTLPLAEIVYQHHERMDGSGYPRQLKGDEILLEARIIAVADVVEAMASHRPHRPSLGVDAALQEIEKNKGILYDTEVGNACLKLFREKAFQLHGP
jgi:PAS domain S-box-containing protein